MLLGKQSDLKNLEVLPKRPARASDGRGPDRQEKEPEKEPLLAVSIQISSEKSHLLCSCVDILLGGQVSQPKRNHRI